MYTKIPLREASSPVRLSGCRHQLHVSAGGTTELWGSSILRNCQTRVQPLWRQNRMKHILLRDDSLLMSKDDVGRCHGCGISWYKYVYLVSDSSSRLHGSGFWGYFLDLRSVDYDTADSTKPWMQQQDSRLLLEGLFDGCPQLRLAGEFYESGGPIWRNASQGASSVGWDGSRRLQEVFSRRQPMETRKKGCIVPLFNFYKAHDIFLKPNFTLFIHYIFSLFNFYQILQGIEEYEKNIDGNNPQADPRQVASARHLLRGHHQQRPQQGPKVLEWLHSQSNLSFDSNVHWTHVNPVF